MQTHAITVNVNGETVTDSVESRRTLADYLRLDRGLTGTHLGCEHGACGACTVLLDGAAVRSCLTLAVQADGHEVTTVEGVAPPGEMHPVQAAMWESHAFQCGFCTPGFIMTICGMVKDKDCPRTRAEIRHELSGNICRCSGYRAIIDGAEVAFEQARSEHGSDATVLSNTAREEERK